VWGQGNGKGGLYEFSADQIEQNFLKIHTYEAWIVKQQDDAQDTTPEDVQETKASGTNKRKIEQDETAVETKIPKQEEGGNEGKPAGSEETTQLPTTEEGTEEVGSEEPGFQADRVSVDAECFECSQTYRDPCRQDLTMYLHALSYKVKKARISVTPQAS